MYNLKGFNKAELKQIELADLPVLAADIRQFLISKNSKTGGHIGANLGVVELTIAMHYVFESPKDYFFFDTGHIGYTHKILTGRANLFDSLNTFGGMNRFLTPSESEHDLVEVSHAGTAPSLALGAALAKSINEDVSYNIAVIGDGSLAEGVALEALNHAAVEDVNLLIIVNDNQFAISPGFGGIHEHLKARKVSQTELNLFASLGFENVGPIDGHDITTLVEILEDYKNKGGVRIIHTVTEKGRGLEAAKDHPIKMHFSMPFDPGNGQLRTVPDGRQVQTFATDALIEMMAEDNKIVAITPSTKYATDMDRVAEQFPERCFDPGMSEQHALSMAAGMIVAGAYPVVLFQSTFMQRAFDQLVHDIAFANNNILIMASRSGFAGYDNATHHGILDLAYLKAIPNIEVIYPKNSRRLYEVVKDKLSNPTGPVVVLFPYGFEEDYNTELNEQNNTSSELGILAMGNVLGKATEISNILASDGIDSNLHCFEAIKPFPDDDLEIIASRYKYFVSIEEGVAPGGINESVAKVLVGKPRPAYKYFALPCKFFPGGNNEELSELSGLDTSSIVKQIKDFME